MFAFADNHVVIPNAVVEEIDNFKKGHGELNANAREVARKLYTLKESLDGGKTLFDWVDMPNGGQLRIVGSSGKDFDFPKTWDDSKRDNDILKVCLELTADNVDVPVILITKDILLGIKADAVKVKNETFKTDEVKRLDEQYTGVIDIYAETDVVNAFRTNGSVDVDAVLGTYNEATTTFTKVYPDTLMPNQFVILHTPAGKSTMLGRVSRDKKTIGKLRRENEHPFGVTARNASQRFMQEALMDSVAATPLVIIKGPAGTAKTFFSLAVALERIYNGVVEKGDMFRKILVCRPNQLMDDDLGYLPGTELEKIMPLMRPIYDNLEVLVDGNRESRAANEAELQSKVQDIFSRGLIEMQAVGYLRGRSIESQWIIVDECQNLSPRAAKAIVTRVAVGTKLIMCGDPQQIDNQYLDSKTNGISYIAEAMKFSPCCSIITTDDKDVVRSELAKEAVKYLND